MGPSPTRLRARYTSVVKRSLHLAASVVLLTVLAGTSVVSVVCAAWCPMDHATEAQEPECHGAPASTVEVGADVRPECAGPGPGLAASLATRLDLMPQASAVAAHSSHLAAIATPARTPSFYAPSRSASRHASVSVTLRI